MNMHKFFLRFMLVSLAVTAVIGVIAVLFQLDEFGPRALGTALLTTGASGLMVRLAVIHNRDKTRTAGLFGMGVVVVAYVLVLPLIWWQPESEIAEEVYQSLWLTAASILLTGIASFASLVVGQFREMRAASYAGLAISGLTFLQLMIGTWIPDPDVTGRWELTDERWLKAALATALAGIVAAACIPRIRLRYWPGIGIVAAAIVWALVTYAIFWDVHENIGATIVTISSGIALFVAYVNLVLFLRLPPRFEWVTILAVSTAFLTMVGVDYMFMHDIWDMREHRWHEWVGRITAAAGIVAGCDTVALMVLAVIQRFTADEKQKADFREISLTCPRCGNSQTIPVGKSECSKCHLEFVIQLNEKGGMANG